MFNKYFEKFVKDLSLEEFNKNKFFLSTLLTILGALFILLGMKFSFFTTISYFLGWGAFFGAIFFIYKEKHPLFLIPLFLFAIILRLIPFLLSGILPYNDPWHEIAVAEFFMNSGYIEIIQGIDDYFMLYYSATPALHVLMSNIAFMSGLSLITVSLILMIILNFIIICSIYLISQKILNNYIFIPALLYSILPDFLQWTMQTVRTLF
ncbi:MAG: hypothetical protein ISS01_00790, partial [Nanoarchaeota archaeon]|nr:hypothetical protein [Nanoarchaeota archaeon]